MPFPFITPGAITPEATMMQNAAEPKAPVTKTTRGERNNNPGNIRWFEGTKWKWKGQSGTDKDGFVIFDTPIHGWRALLRNTRNQPKNETIAQYIDKYASTSPQKERINYSNYIADIVAGKASDFVSKYNPVDIARAMGWFESNMELSDEDMGAVIDMEKR